jgi:metallo-beta-lactamase class B
MPRGKREDDRLTPMIARRFLLMMVIPAGIEAQDATTAAYSAAECPSCAEWNAPTAPFRVFGNTWYVGTRGLGSILIAGDSGHILIDGGLPESAPLIEQSIRSLGFRVEDVRLILNSHAHYDHAGGIAALQRAAGARVAAIAWSADALGNGGAIAGDPQQAILLPFPPVHNVERIDDGDTLRVGSLSVTAHLTAGHTPGGTSWSWDACEANRCLRVVYVDSQTPISADGFRFSDHPELVAAFRTGLQTLRRLRCEILLTPHPGASSLWERLAAGDAGNANALVDQTACARYAERASAQLDRRLSSESR